MTARGFLDSRGTGELRAQRLQDGDARTYALALAWGLELAEGATQGVVCSRHRST